MSNQKPSIIIYLVLFLILIFSIFNTFENTYIVLRNSHDSRLLKNSGDCEKQGYGFIKKVFDKFPNINPNLEVHNFSGFPSAIGYFYDYQKKSNDNFIILLNFEEENLSKYTEKKFIKVYKENKCYLLKKNG